MIETELSQAGVFGKPHGIKGEIAASVDADCLSLESGDFVFARIDGLAVPFRIESVRPKGTSYLLTLKGVDSEKTAAMLANKELLVPADKIIDEDSDDDGQVYLEDLLGFTVTDGGRPIGVIDDYTEPTADNPLFIVRDAEGFQILLPASGELIEDIDFDNKIIAMELPEGLVDLVKMNN